MSHGSSHTGGFGHAHHPGSQNIPADVTKMGYLKKLKTMKKKFFIVRSGSRFHPPRLEYFDSEKKFLAGLQAKRSIDLSQCFSVNKRTDSKHKFGIIIYTKDDSFTVLAENADERDDWFNEVLEAFREGICDMEVIKHYDCVWSVNVQNKGLGNSRNLSGHYRLCLSDEAVSMVKLNSVVPEVVFQLRLIRRCGHSNGVFFMEVGRSSITGEGELWMAVEDTAMAQSMHDAILTAMKSSSTVSTFSERSGSRPISVPQQSQDSSRPRAPSMASPRRPPVVPDKPRPMSLYTKSPSVSTSRSPTFNNHFGNMPLSPEDYTDDGRMRSNSMESRGSRSGASSAQSFDVSDGSPVDPHIHLHISGRALTPEATHQPITEYIPMRPGNSTSACSSAGSSRERLDSAGSSVPDSGTAPESYMEMSPQDTPVNPSTTSGSISQQKDTYIDMSPLASDPAIPTIPVGDDSYAFMGGSQKGTKSGPSSVKSGPGSYKSGPGSHKSGPSSYKSGPSSYKSGPSSYKSGPGSHKSGPSSVKSLSSIDGRDDGYIDMEPGSENMSPNVDLRSPGYFSMTLTGQSPKLDTMGEMRPDKVYSYLSDDSFNGDTPPIRTYSVGSKTTMTKPTLTYQAYQETKAQQGKLANSKSSSAPHLIPQKGRPLQNDAPSPVIPYVNSPCSPMSKLYKSDDSDSFMELDFCRPRTASDSYSYRRRTGSFGQTQTHSSNHAHPNFRERSSSHGQSSKHIMLKRISSESVRTTSQELLRKASMDSLHRSSRESLRSSQESLRKAVLENRSRSSLQTDYMEMSPDSSASVSHRKPGYLSSKKQSKLEEGKKEYFNMTLGSPTQSLMHSVQSTTPTSPVTVKLTAPDTYMEMEPGQVTNPKASKNEQNQKAVDMLSASAQPNPAANPYVNVSYEKDNHGSDGGYSSKQKPHVQAHGKQAAFAHVRQTSSPASLGTHLGKGPGGNAANKSLSPDAALYGHQHPLSRSSHKAKGPIPRSPLAGDEPDSYLAFAPGQIPDEKKKQEPKKHTTHFGQKRNSKLQPKSPEILREESDSSYMSFSSDGSLSDSKNSDIWLPRNKHRIKSSHGKSETVREESDGYISFSPVNVQGDEEPKTQAMNYKKYHPKFDYRKDAQKAKKSSVPKNQDYMSFAPSIVVECEPVKEVIQNSSVPDQSNFKSDVISSNIAATGTIQAQASGTDDEKAYMEFSPVGASSDKETSNKAKKKHSSEHSQRRTRKVSSGSRVRGGQSEAVGQDGSGEGGIKPLSTQNAEYANMTFPENSKSSGKNAPVMRPTFDPSKVPKSDGAAKSPRYNGQKNGKDSTGRASQGSMSVSPRDRLRKPSGDSNKGGLLEGGPVSPGLSIASQGKLPKRGSTPNIPSFTDKSGVPVTQTVSNMLPGDRHSYSEPSTSDLCPTGSLTPGSAASSRQSSRTSLNSIVSKETLNYASLDLGSSDNMTAVGEGGITFLSASSSVATQSPAGGKIRHVSGLQESQDPPPFYAEIDFKKSEELKNVKR
ncbi:insulin receptor substrate 1-like [Liolophura sinensis]|uniref:insulin receptor substrate 1-like n=1 Tax=Liolophura sinensis TaxID=3198878 RepID=UPI0031591F29